MSNSTLSHEVRNPLNSIITNSLIQQQRLHKLQDTIASLNPQPNQNALVASMQSEITLLIEGNQTLIKSAKLLLLNVEGSLSVAQIYLGKFQKQISRFSVKRAIEEVIDIFKEQADAMGIKQQFELINFPFLANNPMEPRDQQII